MLAKSASQKVRPLPDGLVECFKKRKCRAGVDLSMTTDPSAVSLVFSCDDDGFDVLPFFWMSERAVRQGERRDGMPYVRWAERGFIELSIGDMIDYREIMARLEWADEVFDLQDAIRRRDAEKARRAADVEKRIGLRWASTLMIGCENTRVGGAHRKRSNVTASSAHTWTEKLA